MPDAEEQRNLTVQQELYALIADLELEMDDDQWTEMVAPIIDAKVGFTQGQILSDRMEAKWARAIIPTKVLVLRTLADRLEAEWTDKRLVGAGLLAALEGEPEYVVNEELAVDAQDEAAKRFAFWSEYDGAN